jgi:transposase
LEIQPADQNTKREINKISKMSMRREEILDIYNSGPESVITLIQRQESIIEAQAKLIEKQSRIITELTTKIENLEARIAELEARLNQNSRNSSRPPSTDVFIKPKSQRKKGEHPVGGQKGHTGHTLEMVENPDEIIVHKVTKCKVCGTSLEEEPVISVERRQIHEIPPLKIIVTEHRSEHKKCPCCKCNNRAEFPVDVQYPVQYGRYLKAIVVYLCVFQLVPYDRIRELFSDVFGHFISKATLIKAVASCNDELAEVEEKIRKRLKDEPVLHVDETGFRVNGIRHWLHVASTGLLTWYGFHKKRGSIATDAMQILPAFKGTMVHDFWKSYFRYECRHALCNAHLMRELTGISETFRHEWSSQMNELLHDIKNAVDTARVCSSSLKPQQIAEFELRYSRIIASGMLENPVPISSGMPVKRGRKKQSKAKNLLDRCQLHQQEILAFMYDFGVPFENNQAERDIRMVKLQQKISGTFRSYEGAANFCRIRGYISTVKKNGKPVLASLVGAFDRKPFLPSSVQGY